MSPDRKVKAIKLKKDARGALGIIIIIRTEYVVDFARMVKQIGYRVSQNGQFFPKNC
jgi:citrate lyase gamma subunit